MSAKECIWLSRTDRVELEGWVADRNTPQKLVWRSRIVLLSAAGVGTMSIMRAVGKSKPSVWRWQGRYLAQGIGARAHIDGQIGGRCLGDYGGKVRNQPTG